MRPPDADVEAAHAAGAGFVHHMHQQDQAGAVPGIVAERVGVEHGREAVVIDDGAEQRQHLAGAFERVDLDQRPTIGERAMAGFAQELGNARLGKDVAEALRRHVGRFQGEEAVEQPIDIRGGRCLHVTVAG